MSESIHAVTMPKFGLSMTEGSVAEWRVDVGEGLERGDVIADIETSKIANELEVQVAGVLRRRIVDVGVDVPVGELIAVIAEADTPDADIDAFVGGFTPEEPAEEETDAESNGASGQASAPIPASPGSSYNVPTSLSGDYDHEAVFATHHAHRFARRLGIDLSRVRGTGRRGRISLRDVQSALDSAGGSGDGARGASPTSPPEASGPVRTTPAARRLAEEHGIDLHDVRATGTRGRVSKGDILRYLEAGNGASTGTPVPSRGKPATEETLDATRRTIAARMAASKRDAPHFRLSVDLRVDRLMALRAELTDENGKTAVSVNDLLIRAVALALVEHPEVNAQFDGTTLRRFDHADVAVAVSAERGLVTPIVRRADSKDLLSIARETRDLAERARTGMLLLDEIEGATFTLSNLGMFGVKSFDAIINPPQVAILAAGRAERRFDVGDGNRPEPVTVMNVTLSCDHRVIDGATGARFLQTFSDLVQKPARLLT